MKEIDRSHDSDTEEFYSVNFKNYTVNGPVVTVPDELGEAIQHSWPEYKKRTVPEGDISWLPYARDESF